MKFKFLIKQNQKNFIRLITLNKRINILKFVTYVNALKHFDTNYIISFRFYRFRIIFKKKLFEILLLICR